MKKIAILGGSGFVGSYIVNQLISSGFYVKLVNRKKHQDVYNSHVISIVSDLYSDKLYKNFADCDTVIYNIGIIREFPKLGITFKDLHQDLPIHIIKMAEMAGVRKFILMSANGVERCLTKYEKTKFNAEKYLSKSNLEWTIFRPSLIFGDPRGNSEFCSQVKSDIINIPLPAPIFFKGINFLNAGSFKLSPIHVKNVAQFFVDSIENDQSNQKTYELGGNKSYTWSELIKVISMACNKKKIQIPVPVFAVKAVSLFFDQFSWFPITRDQIEMLVSGNTCDSKKHFSDFNIEELSFNHSSLEYLS